MESPQSDSSALLPPVSGSLSWHSKLARFQSRKTNAKPKSPDHPLPTPTATADRGAASSDTRCHFFKIPIELRDNIYDYVAYGEKTLGLHVNMEVVTEPKVHYYDEGLSRTCPQIRQEYTIRLERRIKQLMIDHRASLRGRGICWGKIFYSHLESQTILIAEREVMKDVWVQVDVAMRSVMPFKGILDPGRDLYDKGLGYLSQSCFAGTLTFTLA